MICNKCGKEIPEGTICDCGGAQPAKKKKSKIKILLLFSPLIAVAVIAVLLSFGGEESGNTIAFDNETGAVFNMTMDDLTAKINQACDDISAYLDNGENNFDISSFWNNIVEPQVDTDSTGQSYTLYTAFLDGVTVSATVQDGKITNVRSAFDYDEYEIGDYFGTVAIMSCSNLGVEDASEIIDTIASGLADGDNTMIYKDDILYSMTSLGNSKVAWTVMAVSEDFVKSLEASGKCDVLRW